MQDLLQSPWLQESVCPVLNHVLDKGDCQVQLPEVNVQVFPVKKHLPIKSLMQIQNSVDPKLN